MSEDIIAKSKTITNFSNEMNSCFIGKDYGAGLKEIVIGIVCVSPQFEPFFKIGKPVYTKEKVIKKVDIEIEVEKTLEYRMKVDYEDFKNASIEECNKILARSILGSLDVFEKVKINDFDSQQFKIDLANCFKEMNVI